MKLEKMMKKIGSFLGIALCLTVSGFYVYRAQVKRTVIRNEVVDGIVGFVNRYYTDFIPYEVRNHHVVIDRTEYVRNIATMYDIMQLQSHFYAGAAAANGVSASVLQKIQEDADYYLEIYKKNPVTMRQASAFLALLLRSISEKKYEWDIAQITDALYQQVDDLEPQFELGEVLMALSMVDPRPEILNAQIDKIIRDIEQNEPNIEHIFQYNWISKFIIAYKNDASMALFRVLYQKVMDVIPLLTYQEETNYLAVTYECLASLALYDRSIDVGVYVDKVTAALMKRYNREYGLFEFKNGDMRFDIAGHVINGFICFDHNE